MALLGYIPEWRQKEFKPVLGFLQNVRGANMTAAAYEIPGRSRDAGQASLPTPRCLVCHLSNIFCAHGPKAREVHSAFAAAFPAFLMFSTFACWFARQKSTARATPGFRIISRAHRPPFPFSSLHPHPHSLSPFTSPPEITLSSSLFHRNSSKPPPKT